MGPQSHCVLSLCHWHLWHIPRGIQVYISLDENQQFLDTSGYVDFTNMRFMDPLPIKYVACHGDKCRRKVDLANDRIWCESCHGDIGLYEIFNTLLEPPRWKDMPQKDILSTRVRIEQLSSKHPDVVAHRRSVEEQILVLQQELAPRGYYEQTRARAEALLAELQQSVIWE